MSINDLKILGNVLIVSNGITWVAGLLAHNPFVIIISGIGLCAAIYGRNVLRDL